VSVIWASNSRLDKHGVNKPAIYGLFVIVAKYLRFFRGMATVTFPDHAAERGLDVAERYQLQFYDSLLLATAEAHSCNEFYSEDLNDGQIYCGMKVVNPFKTITP
jgi:predicted nucleic acid-binding protein